MSTISGNRSNASMRAQATLWQQVIIFQFLMSAWPAHKFHLQREHSFPSQSNEDLLNLMSCQVCVKHSYFYLYYNTEN